MKKIEREQWLTTGFDLMDKEGFSKITIDNLCGLLQITKGAFYHHFKNINGYTEALMEYWLKINTLDFIAQAEIQPNTEQKQQMLADLAAFATLRNESLIRAWSYSNPVVKNYVDKVDKIRLEYATKLNQELGLNPKLSADHAKIQYAFLIGILQIYPTLSPDQLKELQDMMINKFKQ